MFRPCIDLHDGKVKQIVGGTLTDDGSSLRTNFVATRPPAWFAELYRRDQLSGGHIIKLGPGNDDAAREALSAFPGGFHIGGGINAENASGWLDAGASHVIVTSYVFRDGMLDQSRLDELVRRVGRSRLVLDLSCRRKADLRYYVVTDRWQKWTSLEINRDTLDRLSQYCDEFLIHAADIEGLCRGIDPDLVRLLGENVTIPTTYAGGARSLEDLRLVEEIGRGKLDLTIGSALDIFGGTGIRYSDAVAFNKKHASSKQ
ncbi:MAG: phosphoribosylformimino-5-aminoimidazole carboxamide ribotide isomerase [Verrucomicrobia bacterium]|nr:phosphoribosylformimino-5-aminoimidazole carboxamide ribotide isomerase [Verrucomicrobiota bacterium]MBR5691198.1 phosphoribosylformimino-5-aminoimidazole carboxamide ribotide isomerase [Verrucomicrobiota bacterium]MBR5737996.1 phosphoribosylformimino-5-aminoimidazole carboxamide ribotide isomerase [Verrucomicrobiota bacterium]